MVERSPVAFPSGEGGRTLTAWMLESLQPGDPDFTSMDRDVGHLAGTTTCPLPGFWCIQRPSPSDPAIAALCGDGAACCTTLSSSDNLFRDSHPGLRRAHVHGEVAIMTNVSYHHPCDVVMVGLGVHASGPFLFCRHDSWTPRNWSGRRGELDRDVHPAMVRRATGSVNLLCSGPTCAIMDQEEDEMEALTANDGSTLWAVDVTGSIERTT